MGKVWLAQYTRIQYVLCDVTTAANQTRVWIGYTHGSGWFIFCWRLHGLGYVGLDRISVTFHWSTYVKATN